MATVEATGAETSPRPKTSHGTHPHIMCEVYELWVGVARTLYLGCGSKYRLKAAARAGGLGGGGAW